MKKSCCHSLTVKMGSMLILIFIYFLVELVVGHILNSVTLIADSFHMLSDFVALGIAIVSRRIGKWPKSSRNTFGWQRAELVGSLTNTIMLTTLTFTILIEAIQRFIQAETTKNPKSLFFVGLGGLVVNIIGLIILRHNHGHSHGGDGRAHGDEIEVDLEHGDEGEGEREKLNNVTNENPNEVVVKSGKKHEKKKSQKSAASMNMKAVYLHVLSDFMGSIAVVVSALILWLVKGNQVWKNYIDPSVSVLFVGIILANTIPLMKKTAMILLQSVPKDVNIDDLKSKLELIEGIDRVHDLHVWLLQSDVIIGTVHIKCKKEAYVEISKKVKDLFHDKGIHCTTIQPEFEEHGCECAENLNSLSNNPNNSNANNLLTQNDANHCELACSNQSKSTSCCPVKPNSASALSSHTSNPNNNNSNANIEPVAPNNDFIGLDELNKDENNQEGITMKISTTKTDDDTNTPLINDNINVNQDNENC